jgi:hypothetical protein|tara:strand:+ start:875 stop:1060 length:186 start_codon:yes stop_codon:yes gene_type:complete
MTRSRAFNRFHRFLARKHRDEVRNSASVLPSHETKPIDRIQKLMDRRFALDDRLEIEETAR